MEYAKISVWWDGEGDFLWVNLADGDGDMLPTRDGKSVVKVDADGNVLGFQIFGASKRAKRKPFGFELAPLWEDSDMKDPITCPPPLEALIAVAMRLGRYETERGMKSKDFFERYSAGEMSDDAETIEWANDYRHFLYLRDAVAGLMNDAA